MEQKALQAAAVAYVRMGWRVVPVEFRGKLPSDGTGWQEAKFSRSAEQAQKHWRTARNVGVMLGPVSGELVDIDLDCPEAREAADFYLPAGAWVYGRAGSPRSHRLYLSRGCELKQFRDLRKPDGTTGPMLLELRAKPPGGAGAQTVLPPSVHPSGELVEWDADEGDGLEAPRHVEPGELLAAVRELAVCSFLARHLGGAAAAREWMDQAEKGKRPSAHPTVAAHVLELAGLPAEEKARKPRKVSNVTGPLEKLRAEGIEYTAALLGLEWNPRRRALRICPFCNAEVRSSHDKREAAGVVKATDSGDELWVHGKCGGVGDAVHLASAVVLGTTKWSGADNFKRLVTALSDRGLTW